MSLYKHVDSIQTKRLVRWFRNPDNTKHEVHITISGKETIFYFDWIGDANRKYNELAAL